MALARLGRMQEALVSHDRALACQPDLADAHGSRGDILSELGRLAEAVESFDRALQLDSGSVETWCNRGAALFELKRYEDALVSFDRVVALKPEFAEAHFNRAEVLAQLGRDHEAIDSYDRALALKSDQADWHNKRGSVLARAGQHPAALASYDRALALNPDHVGALMGRGVSLIALSRYADAVVDLNRLIDVAPKHVNALNSRGFALNKLNRVQEALATYDRALGIDPDHVEALNNRGTVLSRLARHADAITLYDRVLAIDPNHSYARINRAKALQELGRYDEAIAEYERAGGSGQSGCLSDLAQCLLVVCDWSRLSDLTGKCFEAAADPTKGFDPFTFLALDGNPQQQLACARNWACVQGIRAVQRNRPVRSLSMDPLRIAYLSADFHSHPVAYLTAELFEIHDRKQFEVIGVSFSPDDGSAMRVRLEKGFDRFFDVSDKTDEQAAQLVRDLGAHIAVDLMGYTFNSRLGIFAERAAPIQASYLGFPASLGVTFIDYVIADRIVVPFEEQSSYTEKIVHLPDTFQANDSKRAIASRNFRRSEESLPDDAFVFCCFNNSRKFSAPMFDIWMRLLQRVTGSVLWLSRSNDFAVANLRREAEARGVNPRRLVFASPRREHADHLARIRLADLFLDTLPFNAATTASDALWVGVPVLSCAGTTYIGRNGASLLHAVGLPELVTTSLEDYEALALKLATDRTLLQSIRDRLARNRLSRPLFDSDRFRRHIEAAYLTMAAIWRQGNAPRSFSVVPIGSAR